MRDEFAWVIERHISSVLHYWGGRNVDDWADHNGDAIRFTRRMDAQLVLDWQLGGNGNVAEHMWCGDERTAEKEAELLRQHSDELHQQIEKLEAANRELEAELKGAQFNYDIQAKASQSAWEKIYERDDQVATLTASLREKEQQVEKLRDLLLVAREGLGHVNHFTASDAGSEFVAKVKKEIEQALSSSSTPSRFKREFEIGPDGEPREVSSSSTPKAKE